MIRYFYWIIIATVVTLPCSAWSWVGYDDAEDPLYAWSDSEHPGDADSPPYDFRSISSTGTRLSFDTASIHGPLEIGFPFVFYDEVYEEISITSRGLVGFGTLTTSGTPSALPNSSTPNTVIAGLWSSEYYDWSSIAHYETTGVAGARQFIAEFHMEDGSWMTEYYVFQVVLDEASGDIYVYVQSTGSPWSSMVIGVEDQEGARGVTVYNSSVALTEYAAVFGFFGERPRVRVLNSDLLLEEGESLELEIEVEDRQGDAGSPAWDLDGDGTFDDGEGTTVIVDAAGVDGPTTLTPTVQVVDDAGNERVMAIAIPVINVPPVFTVEPVTEVLRRQEWSYDPGVTDPGGDEVTVTALERPDGAVVRPGGALRWVPTNDDVGLHTVVLLATDDDDDPEIEGDGDLTFEFELEVLDNVEPGAPTIVHPRNRGTVDTLRPTFEVETPVDPEGDPLHIIFDIDSSDTFNSGEVIRGQVPASGETTSFTLDLELVDGQRYWWRVRATDGREEGPAVSSTFLVDLPGDPPEEEEDGVILNDGCSCAVGDRARPAGGALVVMALLLTSLLLRRRTRPGA